MNELLPVTAFRDQIIAAVREHPVTIITAETGAGKSTQVPQFLLNEGYGIVVTQPRRLAARTVAARVAQEYGEKLGETIGFRTALERQDSAQTRCLFCTDGLALVRELMGTVGHDVLILDEVHEWNLNIEVLIAWVKRKIEAGAKFKVVVMSATLEAEKLSEFFGGAPVISVPGRLFPVEVKPQGMSQLADVRDLLLSGRNVLWFQPGKAEITKAIFDLQLLGLDAEILPLHGELDAAEQDRCFRKYGRPKCVVSTNVAQTSVTIDDIDAVVDSGVERRIELVSGVEGLYLKAISLADAAQRKGRAGRTKPGVYIDWCLETERLAFPKPEVLRTRLDQTVLRLAEADIDMEELSFFHQPNISEIHEAKRALKALGCMDSDGHVTRIGHRVAKLPVSVQFGRMVIEAERLGVVDDVITVAAILEQGEITARKVRLGGFESDAMPIWRGYFCPNEKESDIMAQLAVYNGAQRLSKDQLFEKGVFVKAFFQAKEKRRRLADALRGKVHTFKSSGERENILRAVCAGMVDHLWRGSFGRYRNGDGKERQLGRESVVSFAFDAKWLVGLPFDLEVKTRRGPMTLNLVRMVTKVDPIWLVDVAPQLVEIKTGLRPTFDSLQGVVVSTTEHLFNGQVVREEVVPHPDHPDAVEVQVEHMYSTFARPELTWVDVDDENAIVPPMTECVVGVHPETGKELKLYGTHNTVLWSLSGQWRLWVRDRSEAEAVRNTFIAELASRQDKIRRRREDDERHTARTEAALSVAKARIAELAQEHVRRSAAPVTSDMLAALQARFKK